VEGPASPRIAHRAQTDQVRVFFSERAHIGTDHPSSIALCCSSLPLTTTDIALLYDDFALGRSVVPPHAACVRPALIRWDPCAPLSLENCVVAEMKDVVRAAEDVFLVVDEGSRHAPDPNVSPPQDYVDAIGEPIDSALFPPGAVFKSPEEAWGIEATRVMQSRIAQARRFRQWALE